MRKGQAVTRVRSAWGPHRRGFGVGLAFVVLLSSRHAAATVDMGGHWLTGIMVVPPGELTQWNCTQIGTALSCIDTVYGTSLVPGSGTIDLDTGDFTLTPGAGFCGGPINGHVDGATRTFSATASVLSSAPQGSICWPAQIAGQRCGNGIVDYGEQCEDTDPGSTQDCCDQACQLIPAGTGCDVDRNACTLDVCDGNGTCALDTVAAAGEPCDDRNACTLTACDAGGTCAVQDTVTCGPCQSCSPFVGCFNQSGCTTTTSTTVTTTTTTSSTTTTLAPTIGIRMRGLALRDDVAPPIEPSSRRVKARAATANDPAANRVVPPPLGGPGDPRLHGATFTLYNAAGSGERVTYDLPAAGWRVYRNEVNFRGYRYQSIAKTDPIRAVLVGVDKLSFRGGGAGFAYTLDEPSQGRIAVRLGLGSAPAWCADVPHALTDNPPSFARSDRPGRFVGQSNAAPPATCPPLP